MEEAVSEQQKARLHQVADLMLRIYQTLADMRYLPLTIIIRGPHDIDKLRSKYNALSLDPAVVYLYKILPYIDESRVEGTDFFQGCTFFNQLDPVSVERGRDPCYLTPTRSFDEPDGQYMYPWYTPLSYSVNHSPVIIYDARDHRIWIVNQIEQNSTDPFFCREWYGDEKKGKIEDKESNWGESGESSWGEDEDTTASDEDAGSEGSSEFWEDEDGPVNHELDGVLADQAEELEWDEGFDLVEGPSDFERRDTAREQNQNANNLELSRSRAADEVLRDINLWYRELKELPGQGECYGDSWLTPKDLRPLYLQNGWPEAFGGDQFEIDLVRKSCALRAKYLAEDPLRIVQCHEGWAAYTNRDVAKFNEQIAIATTADQEWTARCELSKAEARAKRNAEDLASAQETAAKLCPGGKCQKDEDLPLWELEMVRVKTKWAHERAQQRDGQGATDVPADAESERKHENRHQLALQRLDLHEKALAAARVDADRLCPGRTFQAATGIKTLGRGGTASYINSKQKVIDSFKTRGQHLRDFLALIPEEASQARAKIAGELQTIKADEEQHSQELDRLKIYLMEHGDDAD